MRMLIQLPWEETKLGYSKNDRNKLWFGTEGRMKWFRTPNAGADVSPIGWSSEGVDLNGGGYVFSSFGSHKQYQYSWKGSSSRAIAQEMKTYADGTYGRGLIYFTDPTIYHLNVLPAKWADPSMTVGFEGTSLVNGVEPSGTDLGSNVRNLPTTATTFNLLNTAVGFRGKAEAVYVPVPDGLTLAIGGYSSSTGTGGVFVSPVLDTGAVGPAQKVPSASVSSPTAALLTFTSSRGVWLWVGKSATGAATATIHGLRAVLFDATRPDPRLDTVNWVGGMGHAGCRFSGKPTFIENGPDWTGFSATFKEVSY